MVVATRASLVAVLVAALSSLGCDAGGLLTGEGKGDRPNGPPTTEIVSAGTVASNGKYRLVYTMGQPTPQQGVATSPSHRLNGGLIGASNSK